MKEYVFGNGEGKKKMSKNNIILKLIYIFAFVPAPMPSAVRSRMAKGRVQTYMEKAFT